MLRSRFLRRQAETCMRLSEDCAEPATAEELRLMAAEFFRQAVEIEIEQSATPDGVTRAKEE